MLNTKLDLYKGEWLDLVFSDRNKAYGAYELRNHYSGNMVRAMVIAFSVIISAGVTANVIARNRIAPIVIIDSVTPVDMTHPPKIEKPIKPEGPKATPPAKAQPPVKTIQDLPPVVVANQFAKEPVKNVDLLNVAIGPKTVQGADPGEGANIVEPPSTGGGTGAAMVEDNTVHDFVGLEVNPEPVGGFGAFNKFLGKTLRFPSQAQDAGVSGRVILSFVIEKNGEISNINIDKPAGYGFDQEAARVLKLAKAWKPGVQNGQPVRVRYSIPINFQLPLE